MGIYMLYGRRGPMKKIAIVSIVWLVCLGFSTAAMAELIAYYPFDSNYAKNASSYGSIYDGVVNGATWSSGIPARAICLTDPATTFRQRSISTLRIIPSSRWALGYPQRARRPFGRSSPMMMAATTAHWA